jgi:hypothetical protein
MSSQYPGLPADTGLDLLGHEILAEKAAALGKAGEKARVALGRLREIPRDAEDRDAALKAAADAVHAYFIQRELCGFRRHEAVIREYGIPGAVLARLGAR